MTTRRIAVLVLALGLTTLSLAGCKSSSSTTSSAGGTTAGSTAAAANGASPAAPATIDVCSLITAAQASTIVGVTYTGATAPKASTCNYATTTAPIPMSIAILPSGTAAWQAELAIIQEGGGESPTLFTGVGDHAAGGGNEFGVESGNWIIDILGGDPSGDPKFPKSTALANALIPHLP